MNKEDEQTSRFAEENKMKKGKRHTQTVLAYLKTDKWRKYEIKESTEKDRHIVQKVKTHKLKWNFTKTKNNQILWERQKKL